MALRERILADTKDAMKAKETARLSTLRLISAGLRLPPGASCPRTMPGAVFRKYRMAIGWKDSTQKGPR